MKLIRLTMQGFLSFEQETEIEFRDGVSYILGDNLDQEEYANSNGSGKTSIFSAIAWGLYGCLPGGTGKDAIVNHSSNQAKVELVTDCLHVIRVKPLKRAEILKWKAVDYNEGAWQYGHFPSTQQSLMEYLGVDATTFFNTVYLSKHSDSVHFITATPGERAHIMSHIIDDAVFQNAATLVADDIAEINESLKGHDVLLRELDYAEQRLVQDRKTLQKELDDATETQSARKSKAAAEIAELKGKIKEAMETFVDTTTYSLKELYGKKQATRKKLDLVQQELGRARGTSEQNVSLHVGEPCPTCKRPVSQSCLDGIRQTRRDADADYARLNKARGDLEAQLEKLEAWIGKTEAAGRAKDSALERIEGYRREIALLSDQFHSDGKAKTLEGLIRENTSAQVELEARRTEAMAEHASAQAKLPALKELKRAFQQDLRNLLLDRVRTALKYHSKLYLSGLYGHVEVDYPSTTHTGAEKFEILVKHNGYPQDLSLYSGGESWRVALAILLGLRRNLLDNCALQFEFLLVDDPFGEIDDVGCRQFFVLLERIKKEIPQIMVAVPRDLKPEGHRLVVTKKRGSSSCVWG